MSPPSIDLDPSDYQKLEEFRFRIRHFLKFSETVARESGLEPQQHQALLALAGMPPKYLPTIGNLAARLFLRPHSAVELVDRLQALSLVERVPNSEDARQVFVLLTPKGKAVLRKLAEAHRMELEETGPKLAAALRAIGRKVNP